MYQRTRFESKNTVNKFKLRTNDEKLNVFVQLYRLMCLDTHLYVRIFTKDEKNEELIIWLDHRKWMRNKLQNISMKEGKMGLEDRKDQENSG